MNIDYALMGKRIAQERKANGYTQEKLAEKANISNNYLSNIEHNHSIPSLETLVALCGALGVTPDTLLLGAAQNSPGYLSVDIAQKLQGCTNREKRLVYRFIELLESERETK